MRVSPMSTNETSTGEKRLTLLGHLLELRNRLTYSAIALVVTIGVSFIFANQLFEILTRPAGAQQFVFIEITEMIFSKHF